MDSADASTRRHQKERGGGRWAAGWSVGTGRVAWRRPWCWGRDWWGGIGYRWAAAGRIGGAVRQEGQVQHLGMKPATAAPPAPDAVAPLKVGDLPMQLVLDVGQLEITLGQLRTLGAGFTFELPAVPARLVTIRANTREVGVGQLVDLGHKVGVRLVTWRLV